MSSVAPDRLAGHPLALANAAHALVQADVSRAAIIAERALAQARAQREPEAEVAALHALGFARHELGDARAIRTLRAAVRAGEHHRLAHRAARARRTLAGCLAQSGAIGSALREFEIACASLDAHELARSEVFRIGLLSLSGRAPSTLTQSNRALETLRRKGDTIWEARLLKNRGLLLRERGDAAGAERDLTRARALYSGLGATEAANAAAIQLALIALARGDIPSCLARLDAVDPTQISPHQSAELELLRAQALATGRLMGEARQALQAAQEMWRQRRVDDPQGRLEVVRLTLLAGDPAHAQALARRAQRSFAAQGSHVHAARAAGLALAAAVAAGTVRRSALRSGRGAAATLAGAGWRQEALRVQLSVARAAVELGAPRVARRELAGCSALHHGGPVTDRIEVWHVEALLRLGSGDRAGAQRAARTGLELLEDHRETLGSADLRATASEIGIELAQLGLRIALAGEDASSMLSWSERLRASALRLAPVTPPSNPELRAMQTDLRQVEAELRRRQQAGRSTRSLVARQTALEVSIRRRSRHASGSSRRSTSGPRRQEIARALGAAALVELLELDGSLTALTLVEARLTRHQLGFAAPVADELEWLRFALARLARGRRDAPQRAGLLAGARASAESLDRTLIAPLAETVGDRPLVIVPTGSLHALPWSTLPSMRGRPLVVTPSAVIWLSLEAARRQAPRRRAARIVLVAGPRLRHAASEVAAIGALYGSATTLTGRRATVADVIRALEGAAIAHLACHGRFRADSPLFSSLELADGPLNVYELERLRRVPELIVLSACDLASSDTRPGDELLGFAAALIGMGAGTIIASVVPVPDAAAKRLAIALHRHLTEGLSPAAALARAQDSVRPGAFGTAGFVCLGAG